MTIDRDEIFMIYVFGDAKLNKIRLLTGKVILFRKSLFNIQVIEVVEYPYRKTVGLRGIYSSFQIGKIAVNKLIIKGIDGILPDNAHLASRGKIPDELEVDGKGVEIDVLAIDEICRGKRSIFVEGIKGQIFGLRPVMPSAQGE